MTGNTYDAILIVSFGGPEGREDVMPFLQNVLRGRDVPHNRMLEVAEHYYQFDGISPINGQCRDLIAGLRRELDKHEISVPIYWGNRNWTPLLPDTLNEMRRDGVRHALAFVTAAFSSYSSCRQYREDIIAAQATVGEGAPTVDKIRVFYNHPDFVAAWAEQVRQAIAQIPTDRQSRVEVVYTAHSIPDSMAGGCDYVQQLTEACRLVSQELGVNGGRWRQVYQSRSGPPHIPWLEPDVCDYLRELDPARVEDVVLVPIGFLSDHMEVIYDLDYEARQVCQDNGLNMVRAEIIGTNPLFVGMVRKLIAERMFGAPRESIGGFTPSHDVCPTECCPAPQRSSRPAS